MEVVAVAAAWAAENISPGRISKYLPFVSFLTPTHPIVSQLRGQLSEDAAILTPRAPEWGNMTGRWQPNFYPPHVSVVVDVATEDDAQKTVRWAFENDKPWIVMNGGHGSTQSLGGIHDGIQLDMRRLNKLVVSEDGATVTIGAGATVYKVVHELFAQGKQTVTGICECVGMTGALLGGGHGWLQGKHGLMIDQLVEAKMILPNGTAIKVSETSHPDLFWAIKGAGHNFGLVTEYTYKIYDVDSKHTWSYEMYFFRNDKLEEVFSLANEMILTQPADMVHWTYLFLLPTIDPDHPTIMYMILHDGPATELEAYAKPMRDIGPLHTEKGQETMPDLAGKTYMGWNDLGCARGATGLRFPTIFSTYDVATLRKAYDIYDEMMHTYPQLNGSFYLLEGYSTQGVKAVPADSSAFPHRDYDLLFTPYILYSPDPQIDEVAVSYGKKMRRILVEGSDDPERLKAYVNYAFGDEPLESVYGWDEWRLEKLKRVKAEYDPTNVMRWYVPIM